MSRIQNRRISISRITFVLFLLVWVFVVPVYLILDGDWSTPEYVAVPVRVDSAAIATRDGYGRSRSTKLVRLELRYTYYFQGRWYSGFAFRCERFGGNEVMFRERTSALLEELEGYVRVINGERKIVAWMERENPHRACLFIGEGFGFLDGGGYE